MTNEQIKALTGTGYVVEDVRLRPDRSLDEETGRDTCEGFDSAALDPWAIRASNRVVHVAAAATPLNSEAVSAASLQSLLSDGRIAYAGWLNPGPAPILSFTTTWKVPLVPETDRGQTIFLFNSLIPKACHSYCRYVRPPPPWP